MVVRVCGSVVELLNDCLLLVKIADSLSLRLLAACLRPTASAGHSVPNVRLEIRWDVGSSLRK